MRNTNVGIGCLLLTWGAAFVAVLGWWLWLYPTILRALGWF